MCAMNAFYAQSGGVTAVINATACGVIETARKHKKQIANVYAGRNGIIGALTEDMIDTNRESASTISALRHTPGGAFGSARYKLKGIEENRAEYERLIDVFRAHNIGYFFYNGGNDSMDTAHKVSQISRKMGFPVQCLGIPKTVDNDLTDYRQLPGLRIGREVRSDIDAGSRARRIVDGQDVDKGVHPGGHGASRGVDCRGRGARRDTPGRSTAYHPVSRDSLRQARLSETVRESVSKYDYCVIVVSEGARYRNGRFLAEAGTRDAFGHAQLGGVAPVVAQMVRDNLGLKYHYAVADYLQRSARHIASATDVKQAYAVGKAAVEFALQGKTAIMPVIKRVSDKPYRWRIDEAPLSRIANKEKMLPKRYISKDGFGITEAARRYLQPLIRGEDYPPYINGLPKYVTLKGAPVAAQLGTKFMV